MRYNNTVISEQPGNFDTRMLIYHDEINIRITVGTGFTPDGPGVLLCRHSVDSGDVEWLRPGSDAPIQSSNSDEFRIIIETGSPTRSQLARTVSTPATAMNEGLWTCNGGTLPPRYVALYRRGNFKIELYQDRCSIELAFFFQEMVL